MENITEYIVKINGLLILFFLVYYVFLKKETYFQYNRWFLISGLLASLIFPSIILKKIIWIERTVSFENISALPLQKIDLTNIETPIIITENNNFIEWNLIIIVLYLAVFSILLIKLLIELYSYKIIIKNKVSSLKNGINTIETTDNISPFSFFRSIVINPKLYSELELKAIIAHEKVHVQQYHSLDVLISKIFAIVFWYNPIIWIYRKYIIQNLEYIADNKATENNYDLKTYQYTLLKHTTNLRCVALTNPFYQPCLTKGRSLIKKRIVMLNKKPSARANKIKLAIIVPLLAIFVWQFQTKIIAQEKVLSVQSPVQTAKIEIEITKNTTDAYMLVQSQKLKKDKNIDLKFSKVKRNKKLEIIVIKVVLDDNNGSESEHEIESDKPINNFLIVYDLKKGESEIGFYTHKYKNSTEIALKSKDENDAVVANEALALQIPNNEAPPTPPAPPAPPRVPSLSNYQNIYGNLPKPPTPPKNANNQIAIENFEKEMIIFKEKIEFYEKNIHEKQKITDAEIEIYESKMQDYEKTMKLYESKMEDYKQKMDAYVFELNSKNRIMQEDSIYEGEKNKSRKYNTYQINLENKRQIELKRKVLNERRKALNDRRKILNEKRKTTTE